MSKYLCHSASDPCWMEILMLTESQQWAATCLPPGNVEPSCCGWISPVSCLETAAHKDLYNEMCQAFPLLSHPNGRDQNQTILCGLKKTSELTFSLRQLSDNLIVVLLHLVSFEVTVHTGSRCCEFTYCMS